MWSPWHGWGAPSPKGESTEHTLGYALGVLYSHLWLGLPPPTPRPRHLFLKSKLWNALFYQTGGGNFAVFCGVFFRSQIWHQKRVWLGVLQFFCVIKISGIKRKVFQTNVQKTFAWVKAMERTIVKRCLVSICCFLRSVVSLKCECSDTQY